MANLYNREGDYDENDKFYQNQRELCFMKRRVVCFLLILLVMVSVSVANVFAADTYIPFYEGDISFVSEERGSLTGNPWIRLSDVSEFAILFNSKVSFKGIRLYGDGAKPHPTVYVSLYAWDTNYSKTLNGTPVFTETANVFGDWWYNDYAFAAGTQQPGQYIITLVHDGNMEGTHGLNIHRHAETSENIEMYINNDLVTNGTYEAGLLVDGGYTRDDVYDVLIKEIIPTSTPGEETPTPRLGDNTSSPVKTNLVTASPTSNTSTSQNDDSSLYGALIIAGVVVIVVVVTVILVIRKKKQR